MSSLSTAQATYVVRRDRLQERAMPMNLEVLSAAVEAEGAAIGLSQKHKDHLSS